MKKFALEILLLCGTVTGVLAAQQQASVDRPAEPNFAFDDDGGKAQIVPVDFSVAGPKTFPGGPAFASAPQGRIFLGAGRGRAPRRGREASPAGVTADT